MKNLIRDSHQVSIYEEPIIILKLEAWTQSMSIRDRGAVARLNKYIKRRLYKYIRGRRLVVIRETKEIGFCSNDYSKGRIRMMVRFELCELPEPMNCRCIIQALPSKRNSFLNFIPWTVSNKDLGDRALITIQMIRNMPYGCDLMVRKQCDYKSPCHSLVINWSLLWNGLGNLLSMRTVHIDERYLD